MPAKEQPPPATAAAATQPPPGPAAQLYRNLAAHRGAARETPRALQYGVAVVATLAALALRLALNPYLGAEAPLLAFVFAVAVAAWYGGLLPGIVATALSVACGVYFLIPPYFSFALVKGPDVVRTALFVFNGLCIAGLAESLRSSQARVAAERDENARLAEVIGDAAARQRRFLHDVLFGLSEGRLRLVDSADELPAPLPSTTAKTVPLPDDASVKAVRERVREAAEGARLSVDRTNDLLTGVGEAAMNAVRHGGGGQAEVRADAAAGTVQVWIGDRGGGIAEETLHRATLEKGFSSAGTLGHGFFLILHTCDRVHLLTGPGGTTVVLEQARTPPPPAWFADPTPGTSPE